MSYFDRGNVSCLSIENKPRGPTRLQQSLTSLETWGFGLTGLLLWTGAAPSIQAELGPQAIFVWIPGVIIGILINLQVKSLGMQWTEMSGGTPNYMTRLLKDYPGLASYAAIGYFISWVAVLPVNAIILTDLIKANLEPFGISCPELLLRIGFTLLAFIVAFSGTRTLGILHLCFVLPAVGLLLTFCFQSIGWLTFSPASPGLLPATWPSFNFALWAKWFIVAVYAVYACETASSFVADSRQPNDALKCLSVAAWLIIPVYLGGSWSLMRLATPGLGDNTFLNLLAASETFWGASAPFLITFLVASSSLLSCATAVSNCPRILYQLALDGHLSPVFAVVSRRGVLGPSLLLTLSLSLLCLVWGNVPLIVMVTGVGWLVSFMALHLSLWLQRAKPEVQWPWWSLGFFVMELVVLIIGGLTWSWQDLLIGLLLPLAILVVDAAIRRISFQPFHPIWWIEHYRTQYSSQAQDFVLLQVSILLVLICGATTIGWVSNAKLNILHPSNASTNLFVVLLLVMGFIGVAIACWTSLPQVTSIVEARERAEHIFSTALDTILRLDENGTIRQANPAAEHLFNLNTNCLVGQRLNQFLIGLTVEPETWPSRSERTLVRRDQSVRSVEVAISSCFRHELQEYVVLLRDVTKRKQMEEALQKAHDDLETRVKERTAELSIRAALSAAISTALTQSSDMQTVLQQCVEALVQEIEIVFARIWTLNEVENVLELQASAGLYTHLDGAHSRVLVGQFKIGRIAQNQQPHLTNAVAEDPWVSSKAWARQEGIVAFAGYPLLVEERVVGVMAMFARQPLKESTLIHLAAIADPIAQYIERKRTEEQLLHNAFHDGLTELPNRNLFMTRLEQAINQEKRCNNYSYAVLFLDFDRFKFVNDSLGHVVGDQLLVEVAQRLKLCLRPADLVARLGGDEFTILLDNIKDVSDATVIARRIQKELSLPFNLSGYEVFTTVSIGITLSSSSSYCRPEEILRDADIAMYRAKALGKSCYAVFNTAMHARTVALLQLENDLRRAVERQEFQIHYQPIVLLATTKIVGFEALVRWQHPERGLVSPTEFIPIAEETGLIVPISQWVLREACRQTQIWQEQLPTTPPLTISVNLSAKQFSQPDLVQQINQILRDTGLDAPCLKLEITESVLMENIESVTAMLLQLQALNIQLCMDDFGTGYSSLSYLHRFPIGVLKIDRSFINGMVSNSENLEIVRTIIMLAHNLNMDVIAEGVETAEQLSDLKMLGCQYGQGYWFSKPLESKKVATLLAI